LPKAANGPKTFAQVVARLLDRPVARIDVENFTVG